MPSAADAFRAAKQRAFAERAADRLRADDRTRRMMESHGQVYPEALEAATRRYLWETLRVRL